MLNEARQLVVTAEHLSPQRSGANLRWELVMTRDHKRVCLFPSDPPPVLYRGQNRRYSPSFPAIARKFGHRGKLAAGLPAEDQAALAKDLARTCWFGEEIDRHPAMQWAASEKIDFDTTALAQHYELSTGYMDLTQSFSVACFFATCEKKEYGWRPKESGQGVIYAVEYKRLERPLSLVRPVCLQPLPRPAEQWAWVVEMSLGQDFEKFPGVRWMEFAQDPSVSKHFFEMFDGGRDLFPADAMGDVARHIRSTQAIPKRHVNSAIKELAEDEYGILAEQMDPLRKEIRASTELLDDEAPILNEAKAKRSWNQCKSGFLDGVGVRLVRQAGELLAEADEPQRFLP